MTKEQKELHSPFETGKFTEDGYKILCYKPFGSSKVVSAALSRYAPIEAVEKITADMLRKSLETNNHYL